MSMTRRIADFVDRQYVSEEGDVRDNVESLFSKELKYHSGGQVLGREDLVSMGHMVRSTDKERREFTLTGWEERGPTVRWHLSAYLPGLGPDGGDVRQENEVTAEFDSDGLIREVWSSEADTG